MSDTQFATFAGGCFWCIESAFNQVHGVIKATSGYAGGDTPNPTYRQICTGTSGHAEVVQVEFAPDIVDFKTLLTMFFQLHDPTQLNRQGNDIGSQYRSAIFYHDQWQRSQALEAIQDLNLLAIWPQPIVTEVTQVSEFYPAEDYHQGYVEQNPEQAYCQFLILPKLAKFKQDFAAKLKANKA